MKVSIIIPVYQASEYIERCICSVMDQTYSDIECIIVDDCGTDDSISRCKRLIHEYTGSIEFVILRHEQNRGVSAARNTGMRQAKGDWLFFLDSDDEITDNCIEVLVKSVMEDETIEMALGMVLSDRLIEVKPGEWEHQEKLMQSCTRLQDAPSLLKNNDEVRFWFYKKDALSLILWNKLYKRSFLFQNNLFCKEGVIYEETPFSINLYRCLNKVRVVKEITYIYHIHPGSITTGTPSLKSASHFGGNMIQVLSQLTPSWEQAEMEFFLSRFINRCAFCIHQDAASKEAFLLYWKQARHFHCRSVLIDLALAYIASYFKNGKQVYSKLKKMWRRISH